MESTVRGLKYKQYKILKQFRIKGSWGMILFLKSIFVHPSQYTKFSEYSNKICLVYFALVHTTIATNIQYDINCLTTFFSCEDLKTDISVETCFCDDKYNTQYRWESKTVTKINKTLNLIK